MVGDVWSVRLCLVGVWIVGVMVGMGLAANFQSGIVIITPENVDQTIGYGYYSPVFRSTRRDWMLLLFNSTNSRHQSTLQYLLPGIRKQLIFALESARSDTFKYPPIGLIDCYTCISLCSRVGYQDLPLLVYKDPGQPPIRYRGYVTLSGLISFAKSHDPKTSYLAEEYVPEGQLISGQRDLSKKEIKKMVKLLADMMVVQEQVSKVQVKDQNSKKPSEDVEKTAVPETESQKKQKQTTTFIQPKAQQLIITNKTLNNNNEASIEAQPALSSLSQYKNPQKTASQPPESNNIDTQINAADSNNKTPEQKQKQKQKQKSKSKQVSMQKQKQKQKQKSNGDKKVKKEKGKKIKQAKKDQSSFLDFVQYMSGFVVAGFEAIGFGGFLLDIVAWISYAFFFVIFGLICLFVQFA